MSICVCACSHFEVPFKHLSAPTSPSPMSKLFRFSESLGKNNGMKWSKIWKLLLIKGVKSPRKKKMFFSSANFALLSGIFWYWCYYPHWSRDSLFPVCDIFFHLTCLPIFKRAVLRISVVIWWGIAAKVYFTCLYLYV